MEDNKYYTPTIDEFYVGFEYEICKKDNLISPQGSWFKKVLSHTDFVWVITQSAYEPIIRVKYLDQSDIESLGWFDGSKLEMSCFIFNRENPNNEFQLYYQFDNNYAQIYNWDTQFVFQGTIKNKSELKKLMKQLGINE